MSEIHRGQFGWKMGRGDLPRVGLARKWVVANRHGSSWLESGSWRIATGRSGWKVGRGESPRVNLAGNRVRWNPPRAVWLETGCGGVHRGQSGWKPRLVDKLVQRAADGEAAAIEDVGVDLSGSHVFMAE